MKVISNGTNRHDIITNEEDSCLLCKRYSQDGDHACPLLMALAREQVVLRKETVLVDICPMFSMAKISNI